MFDVQRVILTNFKSFKGTHTFTLPDRPGLYLITGRNEGEPRLAGNGAGKSTLLDAIVWCLYGQTPRGLKAGDVVTWGEKTAVVELHLVIGKDTVKVRRSQSPNSLTIQGKVVEQPTLTEKLRMGLDAFTYAVVAPQKNTSFFELKASEKLTVFSQIMNLEYWLERSKQAQENSNSIEKRIYSITGKVEAHRQSIEGIEGDIKALEAKAGQFLAERKKELVRLKQQESDILAEMDGKKKRLNGLTESLAFWTSEIEEHRKGWTKQRDCLREQLKKQNEIRQQIALVRQAMEMKGQQLRNLRSLGPQCPTCNQKISEKHASNVTTPIAAEIEAFDLNLEKLEKQNGAATDFVKKIERNIEKKEALIRHIEDENREITNKSAKLAADLATATTTLNWVKSEIDVARSNNNPYEEMASGKRKTLADLKASLVRDNKQLEDMSAQHKAVSYWIQGFKRVRLFVIEETLSTLELEVNNSLTSLGLSDWEITFDIERENKSGGITKGFIVLIKNPSHPEPVRFEAWSGGEAQRLQLAGDFGLANLIMTQAGLVNKVEFYDEPSSYLSQQGLSDLAETLRERALADGKKILWIDHHSLDFGEFEGTFTVVKDKDGSRIE